MAKVAQPAILSEAQRLFELGFGVHWIKPNSKAPVKSGWTAGNRDAWETLEREYALGFGLGVRLGAASQFPDGSYLANLDVDIKSADPRHRAEALALVDELFPGLFDKAPTVKTGYGVRVFFRTKTPVKSQRLGGSGERVKVLMPTAPVSTEQTRAVEKGLLSQDELDRGYRLRPAWEVEIMGAGKQVVLPPSIHPDTKKPYVWGRQVTKWQELPLVKAEGVDGGAARGSAGSFTTTADGGGESVNFVEMDYLDPRFTPQALAIIFGDGVDDRSAAAFSLAMSMLRSGFSDDEILSVLTDRQTFIGETAFEHRKTKNRALAAQWGRRYCLDKAKRETDAVAAFRDEVVVTTGGLSEDEAREQKKALVKKDDGRPWQSKLRRAGKDGEGGIKPTLENTLLIIRNVVSPAVFRRDVFGQRDFYGTGAPWTGAKIGRSLTDEDAVAIKVWLGARFGFEPSIGTVFEAMTEIAVQNSFHPVQDELSALPAWDGVPRIDTWLAKHFSAEGPATYLAQVFRKWLVGSVTRTFEPGAKFDWMPILEGPQGVGKSIFGAILFGHRYFADWLPNLGDKDAALGLVGRRCVEFAELDRMRRNEVETVKAFVTRQFDVVRPPYGRKSVEYPRGVVFFGTTNRENYLQDETGNRRFCPVRVGTLDWDALERDRDQLWAEAVFIYQLGLEATLYLEGDAARAAKEIQASKQVLDDSDTMLDVLQSWFEREKAKKAGERFPLGKFRMLDLFAPMGPFGNYKYEIRNARMAGKAIRKLGGEMWKSHGNKVWTLTPGDHGGTVHFSQSPTGNP